MNQTLQLQANPIEEFADATLAGLAQTPKSLSPKFLYDTRGSELFDRICDCPEYYVTRTETAILEAHARQIAILMGHQPIIFEIGSGASRKTRIILDAVDAAAYVPIDISREYLLESASRLRGDYPGLPIVPVCADFTRPLPILDDEVPPTPGRRVAFFPGSTIGNFERPHAFELLQQFGKFLRPGGQLLVGFDLVKSREILEPAYDDAEGITAAFNLNLLHRMQRELGAELDPTAFRHLSLYNEAEGRIEMHLVSMRAQQISVRDQSFDFLSGETIHTECSYKYTKDQFVEMVARAGFEQKAFWTDPQGLFGVGLFEVVVGGLVALDRCAS